MLRYSLKRLVLFLVCLALAWLAFGQPSTVQEFVWPMAVAAVASAILSIPLLRAERARFSEQIDRRVDAHLSHKQESETEKARGKRKLSGAELDAAAEDGRY